jgi:hypothetical protein
VVVLARLLVALVTRQVFLRHKEITVADQIILLLTMVLVVAVAHLPQALLGLLLPVEMVALVPFRQYLALL